MGRTTASRFDRRASYNPAMAPGPARRRPAYAVSSVDNALRLLQILRDVGAVRGKEAAEELGISPSSVHRLMAMLVFRGFAVQDESRTYLPGPAIGVPPVRFDGTRLLQRLAKPHLERLSREIHETTHLSILVSTSIRFIFTAESSRPPAGDRYGYVIPAHTSAAGRAILANKSPLETARLYRRDLPPERQTLNVDEFALLLSRLRRVREAGYSLSVQENETGIASVAVPIRTVGPEPASAISIATNSSRVKEITAPDVIEGLFAVQAAIENAFAAPVLETQPDDAP
jgi:IclR family acetate operon transcriptional repressor